MSELEKLKNRVNELEAGLVGIRQLLIRMGSPRGAVESTIIAVCDTLMERKL
jgi:hypothetical protein